MDGEEQDEWCRMGLVEESKIDGGELDGWCRMDWIEESRMGWMEES